MILVTGGTGFVGGHIVAQALQEGLKVRCLVRRPDAPEARALSAKGVGIVVGNVLRPESLKPAMEGVEGVIHLVGIIFERREGGFHEVHVNGTQNVLAVAQEAGVKRYVHMSALGTRPNAVSRYHQTKWEAEEAVRASGLPYTIFRPSIIFGPGDEFINVFARIIRRLPVIPVAGTGKTPLQPIWVKDLARCFVAALSKEGAVGKIYEAGGPEKLMLEAILDAVARVLGKKRRIKVHIPMALMEVNAALLKWLPNPPVTQDQLIMLREDNTCDITPLVQDFGITLSPFEATLRTYLQ